MALSEEEDKFFNPVLFKRIKQARMNTSAQFVMER